MSRPRVRLLVAAAAYAIWTGWLVYLTVVSADPDVLSRPQMLAAPIIIEAYLDDYDRPDITVREVRTVHRGKELLPAVRDPNDRPIKVTGLRPQLVRGWTGNGLYVLALTKNDAGQFELVNVPPSPGYFPRPGSAEALPPVYRLNYRSIPSTRAQLQEILRL